MSQTEKPTDSEKQEAPSVSLLHVVKSVFAAGLGVQSSKNRERDFTQGSPKAFIVAGLIFTLLFIGGVYAVVKVVLANAAG